MDADGTVLLTGDVAKALHQGSIADGGQPQGFQPLGEGPGTDAGGVGIMGEVVAGIRAHRHGMPNPTPSSRACRGVVVCGDGRRITGHAGDEGVDPVLAQHLVHGREVHPPPPLSSTRVPWGIISPAFWARVSLPTRSWPLGGAEAPVLVGVSAAAIEILELQAVLLDEGDGAVAQNGLLGLGVESLSLHPASSRAPMARATRVRESEWCFIVVIFLVCVESPLYAKAALSPARRVQGSCRLGAGLKSVKRAAGLPLVTNLKHESGAGSRQSAAVGR